MGFYQPLRKTGKLDYSISMDKKTISLISVVMTTILCGLPGLAGLCLGSLSILGAYIPNDTLDPGDANLAISGGIILLIVSLLFVAIPVVIGYLSLKRWKRSGLDYNGQIPSDDF